MPVQQPKFLTVLSEVTALILRHLDDRDLLNVRRICRHVRNIIDGPDISAHCQRRVLRAMGIRSSLQLSSSTLKTLRHASTVRSECKWLGSAISSYLATRLPPELCLSETDFHRRVGDSLMGDLFETHVFLETYRSLCSTRVDTAPDSDGVWISIDAARRVLALSSLSTVSKTIFLLAEILHETIQHPRVSTAHRKVPGAELLVSGDVFVWLLVNVDPRHINDLMRSVDAEKRLAVLKE